MPIFGPVGLVLSSLFTLHLVCSDNICDEFSTGATWFTHHFLTRQFLGHDGPLFLAVLFMGYPAPVSLVLQALLGEFIVAFGEVG